MGFAKKKERSLADLADDIRRVQAEIEAFIEDRLAELKASAAGRDLPLEWLRGELIRGQCSCQCALRLIDNG